MSSPPPIHTHPHPLQTLAPHLQTHLPQSLPLLRRIQFHFQSSYVKVFATFPPNTPPPTNDVWTAAFVDRSRAPETECWVFSSYELDAIDDADDVSSIAGAGEVEGERGFVDGLTATGVANARLVSARQQLLSLLHTIKTETASHQPNQQNKETLLIGAVHSHLLPLLGSVVESYSEPWLTFLYRITSTPPSSDDEVLSSFGLVWSTVLPIEFAHVRSCTAIQRSDSTLGVLPCVGVRNGEGGLVGWGFVGVDGSLASLFVDKELRGKGVGRVVASRVLGMVFEGEGLREVERDGGVWGYSHVGVENGGSIAVAKALGGKVGWRAYWVTVDLGKC